jgi:hypothetical protein
VVLVGVGHENRVVLGTQVCLNSFSLSSTASVDVLADCVTANEAEGLDARLVNQEVNRLLASVNNVDNTLGKTSLLGKLGNNHGSTGISFRGFQHECVSGDCG